MADKRPPRLWHIKGNSDENSDWIKLADGGQGQREDRAAYEKIKRENNDINPKP